MKKLLFLFSCCILLSSAHVSKFDVGPAEFYGAWTTEVEVDGQAYESIKIYTQDYFIYGLYAKKDSSFYAAGGGTWVMTKKGIAETFEFHSNDSSMVGTTLAITISLKENAPMETQVMKNNKVDKLVWMRLDKGDSPLFGAWRITQRERNGTMSQMKMGPRKTMKVLSGTRFQWAAYNVETKAFMGTGGGSYTAVDGKYTENIGFFSRDNSRVGASLQFDYEIDGNDWHHKGLSSKGQPINEIWTKQLPAQ